MQSFRVIYSRADGGVSVIIPAPGVLLEDVIKDVPEGAVSAVVNASEIPDDRVFRDAWRLSNNKISHDILAAKDISHALRREARAKEFIPLDVKATIPAEAAEAELLRQAVRDKYAVIQTSIDNASSIAALKTIIATLE